MSRSYKKTPYAGDTRGKRNKRIANHKVRSWLKQHPYETIQNMDFRKLFETWDICDYGWIMTWEEYWMRQVRSWELWGYKYYPYPDKKEEYRNWHRWYRAK